MIVFLVTGFALGALDHLSHARNRDDRNDPVEGDKSHSLFLEELTFKAALTALPDALREGGAPCPKLDAENNHDD